MTTPAPQHVHGPFDVKTIPQAGAEGFGDPQIGRMALDKRFHGDLDATSKGEMLGWLSTAVPGSGGYVAQERVDGTLQGRRGTFVLQHSSTMTRGVQQQSIFVVPDSGTGELIGLAGTMTISIVDKKHFYDFDFTLVHTP
jgi:Protein of unknown function (DUF3224)